MKILNPLYENGDCAVNLASEEYAAAVRKHLKPGDAFVDIVFNSIHNGKKRIITTAAKIARGQMARFILENRIAEPEGLKGFKADGWRYIENLSSQKRYVFASH
ncbi:MAG: peroxide stress protein YaaA [Clostridiales bacterium]|nr:peroxide stress protein YaaA [Clostridiales bacterium]